MITSESQKKFLTQASGIFLQIKKQVYKFYQTNCAIIAALIQSILIILFFLTILYPEFFSDLYFFRQRWFGLSIITTAVIFSYIFSFFNGRKWNSKTSLSAFFQSIIIFLFPIVYFLRLHNNEISIFGQQISTGIVFVPISLLVFFINLEVFGSDKRKIILITAQALLFILTSYSILFFINVDNTQNRTFVFDLLNVIFAPPPWVWLLFTSAAIAFVSIRTSTISFSQKWLFGTLFFVLMLQIIGVIYFIPLVYWYQTLLAIIIWDFLFQHYITIIEKKVSDSFNPKLAISSVYHAVLFFFVFFMA